MHEGPTAVPWFDDLGGGGRRGRLVQLAWFSVWLLFLAYPISDLVAGRIRGAEAVAAGAGLAAFAALYVGIAWAWEASWSPRRTESLLAALAVLTLVLVFSFGASWIGMLIYVGVACGAVLPPARALAALVATGAAALGACLAFHVSPGTVVFLTLMPVGIGLTLMGWRRMIGLVRELRAARGEVARLAVSEERLRFARDLHDLLGHSLSLIVLKAELAGKLLGRDPDQAAAQVAEIESVARQSLLEVRQAVSGYREQSLAAELDHARAALSTAGIEPVVHLDAGPLPPATERLLGWAVREAVTNVIRHAAATRCEIDLSRRDGLISVEVHDDGRGAGVAGVAAHGSGLRGLAERMSAAGGSLDAAPEPGGGFRLRASVPVLPGAGPA